jgi:hypothetical protein
LLQIVFESKMLQVGVVLSSDYFMVKEGRQALFYGCLQLVLNRLNVLFSSHAADEV